MARLPMLHSPCPGRSRPRAIYGNVGNVGRVVVVVLEEGGGYVNGRLVLELVHAVQVAALGDGVIEGGVKTELYVSELPFLIS